MPFAAYNSRFACLCALCSALLLTGAAILVMVGVFGVVGIQVLSVSVLLSLVIILRCGASPGKTE